jgi:nucleoid-associated protein YgaU
MSELSMPRPGGPVLFDWAVEIPEWRAASQVRAARPYPPARRTARVPADLPELPELSEVYAAAARETWTALPGRAWARLTRRGRVVLVSAASATATGVLSLLFLTAVAAGASASGAPTGNVFLPGDPATVVVRDGDTLWGIAERARPGVDPRRTVHDIVRINELSGPELEPGMELRLPEV